jgi:IS4 transposase
MNQPSRKIKRSYNEYPKQLRRVAVWDNVNKKTIELITNQMSWAAATIAELNKQRWQIETFFKAIKQIMKIKTFVGTSENAVQIQIWTALISILILKYLKQLLPGETQLVNVKSHRFPTNKPLCQDRSDRMA